MSEIRKKSRLKFINAALKLFAKRGYRGATIRVICQEAGLSVGALYSHFRNKEALFREVFRHGGDALKDAMRASTNQKSSTSHLAAFAKTAIQHAAFLRLFDVDATLNAGETELFLKKLKQRLRFFAPDVNAADVVTRLQLSAAILRSNVDGAENWVEAIFTRAQPKRLAA